MNTDFKATHFYYHEDKLIFVSGNYPTTTYYTKDYSYLVKLLQQGSFFTLRVERENRDTTTIEVYIIELEMDDKDEVNPEYGTKFSINYNFKFPLKGDDLPLLSGTDKVQMSKIIKDEETGGWKPDKKDGGWMGIDMANGSDLSVEKEFKWKN